MMKAVKQPLRHALLWGVIAATTLGLTACGKKSNPDVTLILSTTTSVNDSGLLAYLAPYLKEEENITLDILAQGSGQAIKTASDGNCDVLIAHSPAAERDFVDGGTGDNRQEFMYNYFVIVGPKDDPANVAGSVSASSAFTGIYENGTDFYSRDDSSGTDSKEKSLWSAAGIDTSDLPDDFYLKTGKGMLDTLIMADNTGGYTLSDKSTFLANADKLPNLTILYEKNDELKNVYSVILVNPDVYPDLQHEAAKRFHAWLSLKSTLEKIAAFGLDTYGESLFFVN